MTTTLPKPIPPQCADCEEVITDEDYLGDYKCPKAIFWGHTLTYDGIVQLNEYLEAQNDNS